MLLYLHWISMECHILIPLQRALPSLEPNQDNTTNNDDDNTDSAIVDLFEQLIRIQNPPHPYCFLQYIRHIFSSLTASSSNPYSIPFSSSLQSDTNDEHYHHRPRTVLFSLRHVRALYLRAMTSVKKLDSHDDSSEENNIIDWMKKYDHTFIHIPILPNRLDSLRELCQEYWNFEQRFGSEESRLVASQSIRSKLRGESLFVSKSSLSSSSLLFVQEEETKPKLEAKRKRSLHDSIQDEGPSTKRQHISETSFSIGTSSAAATTTMNNHTPTIPPKPSNLKIIKQATLEPKVCIGGIEYPAHPYTIRISNVSIHTHDMDLVDILSPKCGAIVHARMITKPSKKQQQKQKEEQESSGVQDFNEYDTSGTTTTSALVQFEERESVQIALSLMNDKINNSIGHNDTIWHITRSNVSAVSLVPPGRHRIRPRGEGKHSKRNEKQRRRQQHNDDKDGDDNNHMKLNEESKSNDKNSLLAFRPRVVVVDRRKKKKLGI